MFAENFAHYLLKERMYFLKEKIPDQGKPLLANFVIIFIGLILVFKTGMGQANSFSLTTGIGAMGAYSKNFVTPLSVLSNQGSLAGIRVFSTALYSERRFMLRELSFINGVVCIPFEFGGMALSLKRFGYQHYNQSELGICYGKNLGKFDLGVQLNYHLVNIPSYGTAGILMFDIGARLHISDKLFTGMQVSNPNRSRFGTDKLERFPSRYSAGLGFEASENLFIMGEVVKEEGKTMQGNASLQYVLAKKFFAILGIQSTGLHFGMGWKWSVFRVDITGSYDLRLGLTPGLMIFFEGKQKEA